MKCRATANPIDQVEADCAVLAYHQDVRPLKGTVGLADWRMCGFFSRLILEDHIQGEIGDVLMMPVHDQKLRIAKVVLIGLGEKNKYDLVAFSNNLDIIFDTLYKMKIYDFAIELPGVSGSDIAPALAAKRFCEALAKKYRQDKTMMKMLRVTVLAKNDQLKKFNPVFGPFEKEIRKELGLV
jgi:hypothetical protein